MNYNLKTKNSKSGFTLVEILITIAVIGILTVGTLASFRASQMNARNAKRRADLESIRQALELFRADNGVYPNDSPSLTACDSSVGAYTTACNDNSVIILPGGASYNWSSSLLIYLRSQLSGGNYMSTLPVDPTNNGTYYYHYEPICTGETNTICGNSVTCVSGCCAYELEAHLETNSGTATLLEVCNP